MPRRARSRHKRLRNNCVLGKGKSRIAFDALGAERGLGEVVAAASEVTADGIEVLLFGHKDEIESQLSTDGVASTGITVLDAPESISNEEDPARAVRRKRNSSIVLAAKAVSDGIADALVSPGPTGATLASGVFCIKRIKGVHRPALAVLLPVPGGPSILLDVGANSRCKSEQLVQFAFMGAELARIVLDTDSPTVGLLSVGEEAGKGTEEVVEAHERLTDSSLDFVGNVEGKDLPVGTVDVVVCDGFTGNVSLKLMEGTAKMVKKAVGDAARSSITGKIGGLLLKPSLKGLREQLDPNRTGGAMLIGLRSCCVVAHGNADRQGMANAIRLADKAVRGDVVEQLADSLAEGKVLRKSASSSSDSVLFKI